MRNNKYSPEVKLQVCEAYLKGIYNNGRYQERYNNLTPTEVRNAAMQSKHPKQYPIPINKRIENYKAKLAAKQQSA